MKKDDDLESALLAAKEPAPAPAKGYAYALICALLAGFPHLYHLRLQPRGDERGAEVRASRPRRHGHAAGGAHRRHQRLLPRRLAGGGLSVRPRGPALHHRAVGGLVPRRLSRHRRHRRRRLRRALGGLVRRRRGLRVRPRRRARLHRGDLAGQSSGLPLLHPR
ncbi:hypothetical protein ZEAMMB73_Zm00001d035289, partial [Zea mays]